MKLRNTETLQATEKQKVYMIGKIEKADKKVFVQCKRNFKSTEKYLKDKGFDVINPTKAFVKEEKSIADIIRKNLKKLADCHAVYIMPCASINNENFMEIKVALNLQMTIIHAL